MATAVAAESATTSEADAAVAASTEATATKETAAVESTAAEPTTTLTGEPPAPTDPAEPAKPTPVDYSGLKLPENSAIDAAAIERTAAFAREQGLSPEQAQKSLELLNAEVSSREAAYLESTKPGGAAWKERVAEFEKLALADSEVGGTPEKLKANAAEASRILKEVFPPSVSEFLHETGLGSSPDVIRGLLKIAKMTSEGKVIQPTGGNLGGPSKDDPAIMYDHPSSKTSRT